VEGVYANGHSSKEGSYAPQDAGFGRVGVDDGRPITAKEPEKEPEDLQVIQGADQAREGREMGKLHPPPPGGVAHFPLIPPKCPGDEPRAELPIRIQPRGQVHNMHRRPAHIQPGDDPVDEDGVGTPFRHAFCPFTIQPPSTEPEGVLGRTRVAFRVSTTTGANSRTRA
jgi:hypothetical protein